MIYREDEWGWEGDRHGVNGNENISQEEWLVAGDEPDGDSGGGGIVGMDQVGEDNESSGMKWSVRSKAMGDQTSDDGIGEWSREWNKALISQAGTVEEGSHSIHSISDEVQDSQSLIIQSGGVGWTGVPSGQSRGIEWRMDSVDHSVNDYSVFMHSSDWNPIDQAIQVESRFRVGWSCSIHSESSGDSVIQFRPF